MKPNRLTVYLLIVAVVEAALVVLGPLSAAIAFACLAALPLIPVAALRFLASLCLLVATVALVADLTPALTGAGPWRMTTVAEHWADIAPASFNAARQAVDKAAGPWLWEVPITGLISWPTFLLFGALAILCGYAGRRRHEVNVYLN